jgi:two-component system, NarL family, nitrate/nitrite response regulator NarL
VTLTSDRVVLVDDHALIAQAVRLALAVEGFDVASIAPCSAPGHSSSLLGEILAEQPRLVLLDLDLGAAGDGAALIQPLRRAATDVVIVTASTDPVRWGQCLAYGAQHVLAKSASMEEIVSTIRRVCAGKSVMAASQRQQLVTMWRRSIADQNSRRARLDQLSRREAEILAALIHGQRVRDIAQASYVSEATVRTQVKSILFKLGVTSQIGAVAVARDAGWTLDTHGYRGYSPGSSAS